MAQQQNNGQRTSTSTQIRNMYSDGMSYMNIKFYNTNLSFQLYPFTGKDPNGRSKYDMKNGQQTTVNFEGAYALYQAGKDIIDGKVQQTSLSVPCNGASLVLERKLGMNGQMETVFSISKNNVTIPFRFNTIQQQVNTNGQVQSQTIEIGLGAFIKTIEGYLTGINADRHLDKLTAEYAAIQENKSQDASTNNQQYQQRPQYRQQYNRPGVNYNRKRYNNFGNNSFQQPQQTFTNQQNFNDYQIQN